MSNRDENIPKRFDVKKKILDQHRTPIWLPVGTISLWQKGEEISGKLRLNMFGDDEYHVFPARTQEEWDRIKAEKNAPKGGNPVFKGEEDFK
jgi:hypothetical protein